jgi:flagellar export protein FliJ
MSGGFRLAAVERLRTRRLDDAGWALAQAQQALAEGVARREALIERLLSCLPPRTADPIEVTTLGERRAQLRDWIAAADADIADLTAKVATARDGWLTARGDLRAVEALHERYRQAVRAERDRREQRLADDLAAVRHRTPAIGEALERDELVDSGGDAA